MDHFKTSAKDRTISRVVFYAAAALVLWQMGQFTPADNITSFQIPNDEDLGVAKAYLGVPVESVIFRDH